MWYHDKCITTSGGHHLVRYSEITWIYVYEMFIASLLSTQMLTLCLILLSETSNMTRSKSHLVAAVENWGPICPTRRRHGQGHLVCLKHCSTVIWRTVYVNGSNAFVICDGRIYQADVWNKRRFTDVVGRVSMIVWTPTYCTFTNLLRRDSMQTDHPFCDEYSCIEVSQTDLSTNDDQMSFAIGRWSAMRDSIWCRCLCSCWKWRPCACCHAYVFTLTGFGAGGHVVKYPPCGRGTCCCEIPALLPGDLLLTDLIDWLSMNVCQMNLKWHGSCYIDALECSRKAITDNPSTDVVTFVELHCFELYHEPPRLNDLTLRLDGSAYVSAPPMNELKLCDVWSFALSSKEELQSLKAMYGRTCEHVHDLCALCGRCQFLVSTSRVLPVFVPTDFASDCMSVLEEQKVRDGSI